MISVKILTKKGPVGEVEKEVEKDVGAFLNKLTHKSFTLSYSVAVSETDIIYSILIVYDDHCVR